VKIIKLVATVGFVASLLVALAVQSVAYPQFLDIAKKYGAKDCRFCHVKPDGGEPFAARGRWLVKEKERRKADTVDPNWLARYKQSAKKK
jgi:hypothetical protein